MRLLTAFVYWLSFPQFFCLYPSLIFTVFLHLVEVSRQCLPTLDTARPE